MTGWKDHVDEFIAVLRQVINGVIQQNLKWYSETFQKFEENLNGESKLPLHQTRKAALEEFQKAGFPTLRDGGNTQMYRHLLELQIY